MFKTKRAERSASHFSFLNFLFVCVRPEALLKQRTLPSTPRTLSARSGSPNTFPFDRPQTCKHNDSACQQNFKKKKEKEKTDEKKQTKNWKKSSNYLLFIVIDRFGDQSTLESVDRNCKSWFENRFSSTCRSNAQNLMSLISTSGRNATIFHFLPLTETKVNWTRPRHQMSSLRSDLIVWFSLIVSLWRSFSRSTVTMIIRMFDVYFISLLFDLFCSFLELE